MMSVVKSIVRVFCFFFSFLELCVLKGYYIDFVRDLLFFLNKLFYQYIIYASGFENIPKLSRNMKNAVTPLCYLATLELKNCVLSKFSRPQLAII